MKILFISEYYPPYVKGGAEISTSLLAEHLAKNHSVNVACVNLTKNNWIENNVHVFPVIRKASLIHKNLKSTLSYGIGIIMLPLVSVFKVGQLIKKNKIQIINVVPSSYQFIPIILIIRLLFKVPIVIDCRDGSIICPVFFGKEGLVDTKHSHHGYRCLRQYKIDNKFLKLFVVPFALYESLIFNLYKNSLKLCIKHFSGIEIVSISKFIRDQLVLNGFESSKISVINNIAQIFSSEPDKNNVLKFSFAGRIEKEKGIWDLIAASEILSKENFKFNIEVAGTGPDFNKLQNYIKDKNLIFVKTLGHIKPIEVLNLYANSSVIVAPSRSPEAFGRFAQESISVGRPIISTLNGGIPEGVEDKITGLLVPVGDVERLADSMKYFIVNPVEIEKMRSVIINRQRNYSAELIEKKRLEIYEKLCNSMKIYINYDPK